MNGFDLACVCLSAAADFFGLGFLSSCEGVMWKESLWV
jgi:hypothetical protein